MIRIDSLIVKNYKNIKEANLTLSNFNVLIGPNNSGKSNFLQVINFLNFVLNGGTNSVKSFFEGTNASYWSLVPHSHIIDRKDGNTEFAFRFSNKDNNFNYTYKLNIGWEYNKIKRYQFKIIYESLEYKLKTKRGPAINIFTRDKNVVSYGQDLSRIQQLQTIPDFASVTRFLNMITPENNPYKDAIDCLNILLKTQTYYFSNIQLMREFKENYVSDNLERIIAIDIIGEILKLNKNKFEILKTVLRDILSIEEVSIIELESTNPDEPQKIESRKEVIFKHFNILKRFKSLSDGSVLLIALVTKILGTEQHIFFIEEPENSLHPQALTKLLNFMKSFSKENQFVIATHSLVVINNINPDDAIVACVEKDGPSIFYNVSSMKDLKRKIKDSYLDFSDYLFYENNIKE